MKNPAQNQHPIHDLLRERWSPRAFSSQPVDLEKLLSLFEAARWSPSGGNLQPWAFIVSTTEDAEAYAKFIEILSPRNQLWAKNAPVLILALAKRERQEGKLNPWAFYDLGQSVAHLTLQASVMGLSVHQMGGFDAEKARGLFEIPASYEPATVIAIGYQGDPDKLPDEMRLRELEARSRKPLADFVFEGRWNEPLIPSLVEEASAEK